MHILDLPNRSQDYLKALFDLQEWDGEGAPLTKLAEQVGQQHSTASQAVKRLAAKGLVDHVPYKPIRLTDKGLELAIQMVRRHRLVETYLCRELGYSMDEVHEEAEILEHAVSDRFLQRIEEHMGFPQRDPHGDPIPNADGEFPQVETFSLGEAAEGSVVVVDRISDSDVALLRHLEANSVVPGARLRVGHRPYPDLATFTVVGGSEVTLPALSLSAIRCSTPAGDTQHNPH